MGQSTDGILFYGISYGEDGIDKDEIIAASGIPLDQVDDGFHDIYAFKKGERSPDVLFSKEPEVSQLYHEHWKRKRALLAASICEVDEYCSCDYPMYFVCVKVAKYVACRGEAVEIPDGLITNPEWRDQLKEYCDFMGLPFSEPKWYLVTMWC